MLQKDKRRALRRHHRERRIHAEYKKWLTDSWCTPEHALVTARGQLRTICSCHMCRNPRWIEGDTMGERKAPTADDDWG